VLRQLIKPYYKISLAHPNSKVIFQNSDDQHYMIEQGICHADATVLIRGSGVDIHQFRPAKKPAKTLKIIMAGRLLWHKGVGDFVEAARILRDKSNLTFVVVGEVDHGNPTTVSEQQLQHWKAEGLIEWWRWRDDMPAVLAKAQIVCLPSFYGEGVPKILIEAAACGKAIITTDIPGCREIVQHDVNGLLVSPQQPVELASAILQLSKDSDARQRYGQNGRELVEREFSLERVVNETMTVYQGLLRR